MIYIDDERSAVRHVEALLRLFGDDYLEAMAKAMVKRLKKNGIDPDDDDPGPGKSLRVVGLPKPKAKRVA